MSKPDLILQWCVYSDYPIYRSWLKKYRDKFNKVILYPSRHHGVLDLETFAKEVLSETWVEPVIIDYGVEDWRQSEVTPCLKHIESDWIWFSEQDFFVKDWDRFYADIDKAMQASDMIGWWNPTNFPYVHPCCLLIKREMLEKTNRDFSAHPEINGADHFSMITRDVEKLGGKITTLQMLGYEDWKDACHLGGLTYVYQDFKGDDTVFGVKNPEMFYVYNYWIRQANVIQDKSFLNLSYDIQAVLDKQLPDMHPGTSHWKKFFI